MVFNGIGLKCVFYYRKKMKNTVGAIYSFISKYAVKGII